MIELIIILFPTFITLSILKSRTKKDYKELLFAYPIYNIIINLATMLVVCLYKSGQVISIIENFNIMNFCTKYLLLAVVIAIVVPYIEEILTKNIKCKIEIRRENKKNEKKN